MSNCQKKSKVKSDIKNVLLKWQIIQKDHIGPFKNISEYEKKTLAIFLAVISSDILTD